MAPEYTEGLFGKLAAVKSDIKLHYEIRPNLSRTQLGRMRRGGLYSVQPGVESFSTSVLRTMKKLTTGMRNLELVKWCTYYDINNLYNILVGFPGETPADFQKQSDLIANIPHLQPPYAIARARADRGSPMYTDPSAQGISKLTPAACYKFIFPDDVFDLRRISYYFEHDGDETSGGAEREELFRRVTAWRQRWENKPRPYLRYRKGVKSILIEDGRWETVVTLRYFEDWAALYEFCADARTLREIQNWAAQNAWVENALSDFVAHDLMAHLDGRYLSLALPENRHFEMANFAGETLETQHPAETTELVSIV
jgi:hypothetical protein